MLAATLVGSCATAQEERVPEVLDVVERYMAAYNEHDIDAMMALVDPGVLWLTVSGDSVSVESSGAEALRRGMQGYFNAVPTARSSIERSMAVGTFVSVWERAHWTDGSGREQTQSALSVYEVTDGRIRRVWYYPAQP